MPSTRAAASTVRRPSGSPPAAPASSSHHPHKAPAPAFDPVPPPSEAVLSLRRNWHFAAVCQFIFTFDEALQLGEFETEEFEDDLTIGTSKILNKIMYKLLHILTYDRRITEDDWERFLRVQYERRVPAAPLLGTDDEPLAWASLSPEQRIGAVHALTEWVLINPNNIRRKMKDEESAYLWRVEPIGLDAKKNVYWLFDDNRLWIQRAPPKPKVSHKKKPKPAVAAPERPSPAKKQKLAPSKSAKTKAPVKSATPAPPPKEDKEPTANGRYPRRASKPVPLPSPAKPTTPPKPRVLGIRQSTRLRGKDDEWQEIPEDWLMDGDGGGAPGGTPAVNGNGNGNGKKRPLEEEEDDDSELTELSDDEDEAPKQDANGDVKMADADGAVKEEQPDATAPSSSLSSPPATPPPPPKMVNGVVVPPDFVEWETIAVTLFQWEHIAEQFEKATHRDEKAFHRRLVDDVVPKVMAELREIERLKRKEELLATRKRSSRLVMRELEAEARKAEEVRRAEEEALHARSNRAQEREKKAEAERLEKERKIKEREERALKRELYQPPPSATPPNDSASALADEKLEGEDSSTAVEDAVRQPKKQAKKAGAGAGADERWELDCEVCGKKGWNVDDGSKMACCEVCNKWQHTACHDVEDLKIGKQKRRWAQVTFKCKECRNKHRRELYAKRQEQHRKEAEEAKAAGVVNGVVNLPAAPQPPAPGELKIHVMIPKMPPAIPKVVPSTNGFAQPSSASVPSTTPPAVHRPRSSPKAPQPNGYGAPLPLGNPLGFSVTPTYPLSQPARTLPALPLERRTSGSHSPQIPSQPPYSAYSPAPTGPTHPHPQHRAAYPPAPSYRPYQPTTPTTGYPPSNTSHAQPASNSHHSHSPPQPPYQYSYPANYGAAGYGYNYNRAAAPPSGHAPRDPAPYYGSSGYYQGYGTTTDPRSYSYPSSYPASSGKPAWTAPTAHSQSPTQGSPVPHAHVSPSSSAEKPAGPSATSSQSTLPSYASTAPHYPPQHPHPPPAQAQAEARQ